MTEIRGVLRIVRFHRGDSIGVLEAFCPACDFSHGFRVDLDGHGNWDTDTWTFNDNWDEPTFSPSMLANGEQVDQYKPRCHSFLVDGVWQYLGDCTHDRAGKIAAVPVPDPAMEFERWHGWHLYPWTDDLGKPLTPSFDGVATARTNE